MRIGFDNDKYIALQAEKIRKRIGQFGGKLYLEFGGKLFDDYHASRVLPGFEPDSKIRMLESLKDDVEAIIVINADNIENAKRRSDIGITYEEDALRLMDSFRARGLMVGGICITHFTGQPHAEAFQRRLEGMGVSVWRHYLIDGYPSDVNHIVSDEGFGKNDYIETSRPLVVVTAPGPGSGKLATCLSQLYHENKRGVQAGYAKYETFPVWNLPLKHPVNNDGEDRRREPLPVPHRHGRQHGRPVHLRRRRLPRGRQERDRAPLLHRGRGAAPHRRGRGCARQDRAAHEPGGRHERLLARAPGGPCQGGGDGRPGGSDGPARRRARDR